MLVTHLDLQFEAVRAMIGLLGYLKCPFQLLPTEGRGIPAGCIELPGPKVFVAGISNVSPYQPDTLKRVEAAVRVSQYDAIVVKPQTQFRGSPVLFDVVQYGPTHLYYHSGLELFERPGDQPLFINIKTGAARPGLRMTPHGLMPVELPRRHEDIENLHSTRDAMRRLIFGAPIVVPVDAPEGQ